MTEHQTNHITLVSVAIFLQVLLAAIDTTIISTAMPTVVAALGGLHLYSWVFSVYLIASTIATPIAGKLSDQMSRKRLYLLGISGFLISSMLCGLSHNMIWLIIFRTFQGIAGGTMFAISLGLVGVLYPPHMRGKMQGFISSLWAIASIIGPPLGAYVVQHFSWRWAFYLNLPVGLVAIYFISRYLREPERHTQKQAVDYAGALTLAAALTCILFAVTNLENLPFGKLAALFGAGILLAVLLLRIEQRAQAPVIPLKLFARREIAAANLTTLATGVGAFGLIIFAPLFVQGVMLKTATEAGLVLLPLSIGWASGSMSSGHLVNRLGYRKLTISGAVLMIVGFVYQVTFGVDSTLFQMSSVCGLVGLGMGLVTTSVTVSVQNNAAPREIGVATASTIFSRALGAGIGVSLLGGLLALRIATDLQGTALAANGAVKEIRTLLLPASRAAMTPAALAQLQHALASGLRTVFATCAAVSIFAFLAALRVSSRKPVRKTAPPAHELSEERV